MTRIWVITEGDFTEGSAFTTEDDADRYVELIIRRAAARTPTLPLHAIYVRAVKVTLDPHPWPEDPAHPLCSKCGRRVISPCDLQDDGSVYDAWCKQRDID